MNEEKKSPSRIKKELAVASLVDKLTKARSVVLADFSGLSVTAGQELKKALKGVKAEFTVAKNTLLSIAARKAGYKIPESELKGPTSVVFSYEDEVAPIKELATFAKKYETPKVKVGFLGNSLLTTERVNELARLPGKGILHGQVVGRLDSPLYGLVGVLNGNIRNLVYALEQIRAGKTQ